MNKTLTFLSITAVAVIAGAVLTNALTNAAETESAGAPVQSQTQGKGFGVGGFGRGGKHQEGFKALQDALDAKDFTAFQTAVKDTPLATQITTQEQFDTFVQMHTLRKEGKYEQADALATQLGIPLRGEKGGMRGDPAKHEAVQAAITANDYTAFQKAVANDSNSPLAAIDTAEKFAKLVKMHSLLDEARAIGEELGLPGPRGEGKGFGMRGMKGTD